MLQLPDPVENLLEIYDFIWFYATMCVSIVDSDWSVLGFHINDFIRLYTLLNDYLEFFEFEIYAYMRSYTFTNAYLKS